MTKLEERVLILKSFLENAEEHSWRMVDFFSDNGNSVQLEYFRGKWMAYQEALTLVKEMDIQ